MEFKSYLELLRPFNCVVASVACAIGYWVSVVNIEFNLSLLFAVLSTFLICGGGQAINDYFDFKIDKKIRPKKPIPSGRIMKENALYFSIICFILGIILSYQINFDAFLIATFFTTLLIFYSALLQNFKFVGNWIVASGTGITLIYGATISQAYYPITLLALSAVLANVSREIIKDYEDLQADKGHKITLPMLLPQNFLSKLILLLYITSVGLAVLIWKYHYNTNLGFIVFTLISGGLFLKSLLLFNKNKFKLSQKQSKTGMLAALVAFLCIPLLL